MSQCRRCGSTGRERARFAELLRQVGKPGHDLCPDCKCDFHLLRCPRCGGSLPGEGQHSGFYSHADGDELLCAPCDRDEHEVCCGRPAKRRILASWKSKEVRLKARVAVDLRDAIEGAKAHAAYARSIKNDPVRKAQAAWNAKQAEALEALAARPFNEQRWLALGEEAGRLREKWLALFDARRARLATEVEAGNIDTGPYHERLSKQCLALEKSRARGSAR